MEFIQRALPFGNPLKDSVLENPARGLSPLDPIRAMANMPSRKFIKAP